LPICLLQFTFETDDRVCRGGDLLDRGAGKSPLGHRFELLTVDHGRSPMCGRPARRVADEHREPISPIITPTGSMIIVTPRPRPITISTKPTRTVTACSRNP